MESNKLDSNLYPQSSRVYECDVVDNTDAIKTEYRTLGEVMEFFPKNSKHQAYLYMEKRQKELLKALLYGTK
jgi:hypothetical protein